MRSCANLFLTNFRVKSKNRVNGNSQHLLIKSLEDAKNRALVRG
jgi:glutathione peroxidase-family protein